MSHPLRILSGIQPTGALHIGNYLGALVNWVELQNAGTHDCLYCIVDLHAITLWQDPHELRQQSRMAAATYLACGLDPKRSILFAQSSVPGHAQLAWVLSCVARFGWLNRMTQFKEKSGKDRENVSLGLFAYPALMAADILLYKATHVPVGEDQKQHIELARDTAQKFNNDFQAPDFFPLPEPMIQGPGTRIMSLRDGTKKMSKSDPSDFSRIHLTDPADEIANKIRKAKTDPNPLPETEAGFEGRPEAENLVSIFAAVERTTTERVLSSYGGKSFSEFKSALSDALISKLEPIGSEIKRLTGDPEHLDRILKDGAERANAQARPVIDRVYELVGFFPPLG